MILSETIIIAIKVLLYMLLNEINYCNETSPTKFIRLLKSYDFMKSDLPRIELVNIVKTRNYEFCNDHYNMYNHQHHLYNHTFQTYQA